MICMICILSVIAYWSVSLHHGGDESFRNGLYPPQEAVLSH